MEKRQTSESQTGHQFAGARRAPEENVMPSETFFQHTKPPSVFIVDDVPINIQVLSTILSEEKYNIAVATNGEQALKMIRDVDPDIVLLDIMMPGIDGFEVCKELKSCQETLGIPIIFLTARTDTEDIINGFHHGAVDFVTKPFNTTELKARVRTHIELKRSRDLIVEMNKRLLSEIEEKERMAKDRERLVKELEKMAITDSMTALYNHRHSIELLKKEIAEAKRYSQPLSLLMLDIDHFKSVNDTYGHPDGDTVLIEVSATIKELLRDSDHAGRYGGEEFIVVLPHTATKEAHITAERIRKNVEAIKWDIEGLRITISAGVATFDNETPSDLIKKADHLLYQAKNNGRNQVQG